MVAPVDDGEAVGTVVKGYRTATPTHRSDRACDTAPMALQRLVCSNVVAVLETGGEVPRLLHWGCDPGGGALEELIDRPWSPATLDQEAPLDLVPTAGGFHGRPGLQCHRATGPVFPRFGPAECSVADNTLRFRTRDDNGGVEVDGTIRVGDVVEIDLGVTNVGTDALFLDHLSATLPVPDDADEVLRLTGRWAKEFQPERLGWPIGVLSIENRRGRTSHDATPTVFCGRSGFSEHRGDVRGVHLAWSGNHTVRLERLADGRRCVQLGELLMPGEVILEPGARYQAPTVLATAGTGLTSCSQRLHAHIRRSLPNRPRPVLLNTWEAVYFDHDVDRLRALADRASAVGVERFVLDDGWFGGRRHDRAGLGDWWVSPEVYPDGLAPLIDHVTGLGMEFGIWVEPEMVNPDSELYRAHPEWVLGDTSVMGRNQFVLDLSQDACWAHLLNQLDRLLTDHDIGFVKWDMNRDIAGAGAHRQTLALYRLVDELLVRHPDVEFESCASGGGRADAGILGRTVRIWTSDCNDPVERQSIQRGFSLVFPPEVMGAHIGPPRAHTTGRTSRLSFRAATALFGHLGVEWNLLDANERELEKLSSWIALHKRLRPLLHGGDVVRLDHPDPDVLAHGVVAADRSEAVFSCALVGAGRSAPLPRLVLAGLDPDRTYRLERVTMPGDVLGLTTRQPTWLADGVEASGRALMTVGLQPPVMLPESAVLLRLTSS